MGSPLSFIKNPGLKSVTLSLKSEMSVSQKPAVITLIEKKREKIEKIIRVELPL